MFTGLKPVPSNERWLADVWWPLPMPVLQTRGGSGQAWCLRAAEEPVG